MSKELYLPFPASTGIVIDGEEASIARFSSEVGFGFIVTGGRWNGCQADESLTHVHGKVAGKRYESRTLRRTGVNHYVTKGGNR